MASKKKTKKKTQKTSTLVEFRAWLEGVEEMQGDDWVPTTEQWKRIRNKIDSIEDSIIASIPPITPVTPIPPEPRYPTIQQGAPESSFDSMALPQTQLAPPAPMNPNTPMASGTGNVKTPDIDTSSGEYTSAFE